MEAALTELAAVDRDVAGAARARSPLRLADTGRLAARSALRARALRPRTSLL